MQLQSFAIPALAGNGILSFQNHSEPMLLSHYRRYKTPDPGANSVSHRGAGADQRVKPNSVPGGQRCPAQRPGSPHAQTPPGRGVRGGGEPRARRGAAPPGAGRARRVTKPPGFVTTCGRGPMSAAAAVTCPGLYKRRRRRGALPARGGSSSTMARRGRAAPAPHGVPRRPPR